MMAGYMIKRIIFQTANALYYLHSKGKTFKLDDLI